MTTIRAHDYEGVGCCKYCGDKEIDNMGNQSHRECIGRELPRPVPVSVFNDLSEIGERMKAIQEDESKVRSGLSDDLLALRDYQWADGDIKWLWWKVP